MCFCFITYNNIKLFAFKKSICDSIACFYNISHKFSKQYFGSIMSFNTLNHLPLGHEAVIARLLPESLPFRRKLLAMGITPGCKVSVVRFAPFGDPLEIKIRGFRLCLRRSEAASIEILEIIA